MPFSSADLLSALPRLRRYARFLTDDSECADAMVEETVRRAQRIEHESWRTTPTLRLLAILRVVHADRVTSSSPPESLWPAVRESAPPTSDSTLTNPERKDDLLAHLFRLPLEQREVLVLVAVERLSYDDAAALLDVPVATVFARLVQAREALRALVFDPTKAFAPRS